MHCREHADPVNGFVPPNPPRSWEDFTHFASCNAHVPFQFPHKIFVVLTATIAEMFENTNTSEVTIRESVAYEVFQTVPTPSYPLRFREKKFPIYVPDDRLLKHLGLGAYLVHEIRDALRGTPKRSL